MNDGRCVAHCLLAFFLSLLALFLSLLALFLSLLALFLSLLALFQSLLALFLIAAVRTVLTPLLTFVALVAIFPITPASRAMLREPEVCENARDAHLYRARLVRLCDPQRPA
jgi:hypothetical protein